MTGLYNLLFGERQDIAEFCHRVLNLNKSDFGRYRDTYVTKDHIVIHTRNGGGNREEYQHVFDWLSGHPLYSHDADDDFDCTYANIFFNHPPEHKEALQELSKGSIAPSEKWKALFKAMGS